MARFTVVLAMMSRGPGAIMKLKIPNLIEYATQSPSSCDSILKFRLDGKNRLKGSKEVGAKELQLEIERVLIWRSLTIVTNKCRS